MFFSTALNFPVILYFKLVQWFPAMRRIRGAQGEERQELVDHVVEGLFLLEEAFGKYTKGRISLVEIELGSLILPLGPY